jgi:hypothetical protein
MPSGTLREKNSRFRASKMYLTSSNTLRKMAQAFDVAKLKRKCEKQASSAEPPALLPPAVHFSSSSRTARARSSVTNPRAAAAYLEHHHPTITAPKRNKP